MTVETTECAGCVEAALHAKRQGPGAWVRCDGCGASVAATRGGKARAQRAAAHDEARTERRALDATLRDLDDAARWRTHAAVRGHEHPIAYGDLEPQPSWLYLPAPPEPLRPARERDEGASERQRTRGREMDAKLRWLEWAARREPALADAVRVLVYLSERLGRGVLDVRRRSVAELVGTAMATPKQLAAWGKRGDGLAMAAAHGQELVRWAVEIWRHTTPQVAREEEALEKSKPRP